MKKLYIFLILLLSQVSYSYINIYPTGFDKDITNGATESFKLYNRTNEEVKYRIYIEKNVEENSMADWIEIYPQSISLKPLEEKELRILVAPPKKTKNGVYKARLVVKEVEVPSKNKRKKVKIMTIFKLNMKGYIGEINATEERK